MKNFCNVSVFKPAVVFCWLSDGTVVEKCGHGLFGCVSMENITIACQVLDHLPVLEVRQEATT